MRTPPTWDEPDILWMRRALAEAARGRGAVEPNPMVGAVLVRDGTLIAVGHHQRFGGPHAEIVALGRALDATRGATLYVTLEPCCHHGKTPPCAEALIASRVTRVVAAMRDPFPKVAGGGFKLLIEAGIAVDVGLLEDEAKRLNAPYLKRLRVGRPFVTAKWAMTLDGRIATASGHSQWISGERSRVRVHDLRRGMDAILVGLGTAIADNPRLTARPAGARVASRVVLDSSASLPTNSNLVATAREVPTIVAVNDRADAGRVENLQSFGCEIVRFAGGGAVPVGLLLDDLGRRGMTNVLVEGGGRVLGAFLDAGEVDAVEVFIAPIVEGGPPRHVPVDGMGVATMDLARRLSRHTVAVLDGDIWLSGAFAHPWLTPDGPVA